MQIINLKWLPLNYQWSNFFQINRVQAVDETDKLSSTDKVCKFHENLTINADCIT